MEQKASYIAVSYTHLDVYKRQHQYQGIDEELYEEIEEVLITSDIGVETTLEIVDIMKDRAFKEKITQPQDLKNLLKDIILSILVEDDKQEKNIKEPSIYLIIGVNGVGKTTTIGKLAAKFKNQGKSVLLAAGDTFRACLLYTSDHLFST